MIRRQNIHFILVRPAYPTNVGMISRSIASFGLGKLRLVRPQRDHINERSMKVATFGKEILQGAEIYDTLKEAIGNCQFALATSHRIRKARVPYIDIDAIGSHSFGNEIKSMAVVMGSEKAGLTTEEIEVCDAISSIPVYEIERPLNMAQAATIYAQKLFSLAEGCNQESPQASNMPMEYGSRSAKEILMQMAKLFSVEPNAYPLSEEQMQWIEYKIKFLSEQDTHFLIGIAKQLAKERGSNHSGLPIGNEIKI